MGDTVRKRLVGMALMSALVFGTAACDWAMVGFDGGRTGFSAFETTIRPANAARLRELWHANVGSSPQPPVAAGDRVFTVGRVDDHGELRAYDARTGGCSAPGVCAPRWSQPLPTWGTGPVVAGANVFAGGAGFSSTLVGGVPFISTTSAGGGFDLVTGQLADNPPGGGAYPFVDGGQRYRWSPDVRNFAFLSRQLPYWHLYRSHPGSGDATQVIDVGRGLSYVPGPTSVGDGHVFILDATTFSVYSDTGGCTIDTLCQPSWIGNLAHAGGWDGLATVAHHQVYVPEVAGGVEVFAAAGCGTATCAASWRAHAGDVHVGAVAVDANTLFVSSDDGHLYAFAATGCGHAVCEPRWSVALGAAVHNPSIAGSIVYAPTDDGRLAAIDARGCAHPTCTPIWTSTASGSPIRWAPVVSGGRVFVVDDTGRLEAFGLPS